MTNVSSEGTVRIGPTLSIPGVLRDMGYDPVEMLASAGVDNHVFDDPDNLLSFSSRMHLMEVCREQTGCSHFGLMVGQRADLSSFGLVGYLAMHSENVGGALHALNRYLHLHGQGATGVLEESGNLAFFGYEIYQTISKSAEQLEDAAIAALYKILRQLCGGDWGAVEVWFAHRKPENIAPFRKFFQVPLRFDMDKSGVFFSSRWLKRSVKAADPELHRLLQKRIDELETNYCDDFPEQVRRVLHNCLLTRHVSAEHVAALFSIHSRTLHRRLKSHGVSFQELADDCRFNIARQMLETSDAPLIQIAQLLDYTDARAFSRAFKRWSGMTPAQWKNNNR